MRAALMRNHTNAVILRSAPRERVSKDGKRTFWSILRDAPLALLRMRVAIAAAVGLLQVTATTPTLAYMAYVTNENSNDLSVIDLGTETVTATIPIGSGPRKVAVQPTAKTPTAAAIAP